MANARKIFHLHAGVLEDKKCGFLEQIYILFKHFYNLHLELDVTNNFLESILLSITFCLAIYSLILNK